MGSKILTFVLVFVGIFLMMKTCAPKPERPQGLPREAPDAVPLDQPLEVLGTKVFLGPDGSVASVSVGGAEVVRAVRAGRRPFHVYLGQTQTPSALPDTGWTSEALPEGGRKYVLATEKLRIEKTVQIDADGLGLALRLKAEGAPGGLILTGASGIELTGAGAPFAFAQYAGKEAQRFPFSELKQEREAERRRLYAAFGEPVGDRLARFGLFGKDFCLSLEEPPAVSKFYMDVYRAARDGGDTDEAETWLDLVAPDGRLEETFKLRWMPRAEAAKAFPGDELQEGKDFVLEDETFRVVFTDRGAAVRELWLKAFSTVAGEAPSERTWIPLLGGATPEGERALTLSVQGRAGIADRVWAAEPSPDGRSIRFSLALSDGWKLWKQVTLPEKGRFDLDVEVGIEAPGGATGQAVASLVGPSGSYIVDCYRGIIGAELPAAFILDNSDEDDTKPIEDLRSAPLDRGYAEARRGLFRAIGTRGAYFVCALVSEDPKNAVTNALARHILLDRPQEREDGKPPTLDSMLGRVNLTLALQGGRATQRFKLYAGPNETSALRALKIEKCVNFGFFGFIGRALMWLMKTLEGLVGSYGIAIMLMTVIVRALLLPISFKTQLSMQRYGKKMQKIKPLLEEVQKRHAKDPARMNQERMKIMREHGLGLPLGCLTIFLQIPIWYALFQALRVEFALRHQSFLWAADLSMPDRLFGLPVFGFVPLSWLPHWFNLLPILMLVLWVIQQKLTPTPGSDDPQVQMQMKMMKFMPYVFFFFLYNYAAGLALYMCVSSVWSIAESKLVRRAINRL